MTGELNNMFKTTIGLEIHCELKTQSKIFCDCENVFGGEPNTHCCPICSGFPGVLPVLNKRAVEYTVKAGLALNCGISRYSKWDRKNYFYPDLPKAWQTSQYDLPLCLKGEVQYILNGERKSVRINRIHLEEDAGKLIHEGKVSYVDYNRCGVPLMEIVTEPDLHSADEAVAFLDELKSILKYSGVSDVKMQEGSLRCDVNLSVAKEGATELGTRTETKNLNSFSSARRSILFETQRQIEILESSGKVVQETRRWDDAKGIGYSMRGKENAHDYRYFPEPDLMPVILSDEDIENIRLTIPELKGGRIVRYTEKLGLPEYDALVLTADKDVADLFDECVKMGANAKKASNYIMSEVLRMAKSPLSEDVSLGINASQLYEILNLVDSGAISLTVSKEVLQKAWNTDKSPAKIVEDSGLKQSSDSGEIEGIVQAIIDANPKVVADFRSGNEKVMAFFVGQVMKVTKGKVNPKIVNEVLTKLL